MSTLEFYRFSGTDAGGELLTRRAENAMHIQQIGHPPVNHPLQLFQACMAACHGTTGNGHGNLLKTIRVVIPGAWLVIQFSPDSSKVKYTVYNDRIR